MHKITQTSPVIWECAANAGKTVGIRGIADTDLMQTLDDTTLEQALGVASLPGVVDPVTLMPDAHTGYGFPIGAVAACDADENGIISAGGVGFDIGCGVRTLVTNLGQQDLEGEWARLADALFQAIPAGVGSNGGLPLSVKELDAMLKGGAAWAVSKGFGSDADCDRCEEQGRLKTANPDFVSMHAKERQTTSMGTLGSGNHYLEVQVVDTLYDVQAAAFHGLEPGRVVISIHSGSRGLGHQTATDYVKMMLDSAHTFGLDMYAKELACAPIGSSLATSYLGAMAAAMNCALANRQILTHKVRTVLSKLFPGATARLLYDVSHNTCRLERHSIRGREKNVYVHRKGATRALGPSHPDLPSSFRGYGQPILIGGSMGTASYLLHGNNESASLSYCSAAHGAGRVLSRKQAMKEDHGKTLIKKLSLRGTEVRTACLRSLPEESPRAYKDIDRVSYVLEQSGIASKIARFTPRVCVKG